MDVRRRPVDPAPLVRVHLRQPGSVPAEVGSRDRSAVTYRDIASNFQVTGRYVQRGRRAAGVHAYTISSRIDEKVTRPYEEVTDNPVYVGITHLVLARKLRPTRGMRAAPPAFG